VIVGEVHAAKFQANQKERIWGEWGIHLTISLKDTRAAVGLIVVSNRDGHWVVHLQVMGFTLHLLLRTLPQ